MKHGLKVLISETFFMPAAGALVAGILAGCGASEPETGGGPSTFRRLSEAQYIRSIESIFGAGIEIPGRFDPPRREEGLLAVGNSRVMISRAGFEQAELRARSIAAQVLSEKRREQLPECVSQVSKPYDKACAALIVKKYGRLLYRRPLEQNEVDALLDIIGLAAQTSEAFAGSLEAGLSRMLLSPHFLFLVETIDEKTAGAETAFLDEYSLASRLSFLLWDAPPDGELLDAAAAGALGNGSSLEEQVDRMIMSPKFEQGIRAFFSDMYSYDLFGGLTKEQAIYPMFSSGLAEDAMEQALRTIVDHLVVKHGDYRDLFVTRHTFLNRRLSALYAVPATENAMEGWAPYTFAPGDNRAGLLSLAAFLMLDVTHEGRTSPTIRGKAVRELYLCQKVPPPPPAVDFKLVQDTQNSEFKTARDRLRVHATNPTCAGCHAITDPIGLSMENYDAVGAHRKTENNAPIDASGTFEGKAYANALEFQQILRDSPAVTACLAKRVYEYGVGRPVTAAEVDWMRHLREQFADDGYAIAPLMKKIATSDAFRTVSINPDKLIATAK